MEGSLPWSGQAGFHFCGCGEQGCIKIILQEAVEVTGLSAEHLGRFGHASESSHSHWARCPGTAQYSLPALWFLIEYGLFAAFQGVNSLRSGAPFSVLLFGAWVKRIIGVERNGIACHIRQYQKIPS